MEHERLVDDPAAGASVEPDASERNEPPSAIHIDVDRAVGHEFMLDETNWMS